MTTAAIDQQLAQEQAKMALAQANATHAAEQLAKDPGNPRLRVAVVEAQQAVAEVQQAVAEVQIGIDALNAARIAGEKADTKEADEAYRAKTVAMFNQAKALIGERAAAGKAVDAALQGLRDALGAWKQLNDEASVAANGFYQRLYGNHNPSLLNMDGAVVNALADQISEAVGLIPVSHHCFTFSQHTRHVAGVPESVEKDAKESSARFMESLEGIARAKGVA